MTAQVYLLFKVPIPFALAGFVFAGSVCSYNFHWYLTPPETEAPSVKLSWNLSHRTIHLVLFIIGLIMAAVFSLLLIRHWVWLGVTAFFTFLYSAPKIPHRLFFWLRRIAVGKTIFLALAWTHVTAFLPLIMNGQAITTPEILYVVNRFFFIYAICILFDYRDLREDRRDGIRSLITLLSERGIDRLFRGSVLVFLLSAVAMGWWLSWLAVAALLVPGLVLVLLYNSSKKTVSDYRYYFVLDGLMMLSAPLLLLVTFAR